jgi:general secretion pathway protein D
VNFKQRMALLTCTVALSSCAILDQQASAGGPAPGGQATPQPSSAASTVSASQQTAIPVIGGGNSIEQQALIDAINRDGQVTDFPGYTETVPAPQQTAGEDIVELNYEQADLRLVLEELADALDISLVIDPSIDDRVSVRTSVNAPLAREDIWPLIRLLTRDAGIVLEQVGNLYNARKLPSALAVEITTAEALGQGTAARIMQITPLTYVSTEAVTEVLGPLLEPEGEIRQISNNNLLSISGTESQLERVNQLLLLIDADPFANQGIQLYQLANANAVEVATELAEILLLIEGAVPAYQVRGIERINAILVTAPATRGFEEISRWVQILDAAGQEQVEQLFHYPVKNLNALELAETLSSVFEEDDEELSRINQQTAVDRALADELDQTDTGAAFQPIGETAVAANLSVKIVADEASNSLLIRSTARDYRQLLTTINQLDAVPLQVMINAVIAQITLTDSTKFGVDWSRVADNSIIDPTSTIADTAFLPGAGLGGLLFTKSFLDGASRVDATLEAIAANNDVQLLARPSLTVINNQEGAIRIGSEVPVEQGASVVSGGISTTNIQYRDTGIVLTITPQINNDGIVNLLINQSLSSVDSGASGINGNPVFNNQEIETTIVVRDGENVVLGGLIQSDIENLNTGVPVLNRLPVVGNLFSYQQDRLERKELFIVLRPEVINLNEENSLQYSDILDRFAMASELLGTAGL